MSMLMLLIFLIGAVLGMRFRVLVLSPAIGLILAAILAGSVVRADSALDFAAAALLAATCLQIGYLGGVATRYGLVAAYSGHRLEELPENTPAPQVPPTHSIGGAPSTAYRG